MKLRLISLLFSVFRFAFTIPFTRFVFRFWQNTNLVLVRKTTIIFVLVWQITNLSSLVAQKQTYPQEYFRSPLDIDLSFSGHFGEIRSNHYHSGVDIRTQGKVGFPVYAPADGYVSRIKIQAFGGGKSLYINHPNGYTTVYMHLDRYADPIASYVEAHQYKHKTYEFDIAIPPKDLFVKQGQLIAYSGNSGSSGGAHLHYEIRETSSEQPINPLFFGLPYADDTPPVIEALALIPAKTDALINGENEKQTYALRKQNNQYVLKGTDTISVSGDFYIGVACFDHSAHSHYKNGIYSLSIAIDEENVMNMQCNKFSFSQSRTANSLIDYKTFVQKKKTFICTRKQPGARLPFIAQLKDKGIFRFQDNFTHKIQVKVGDYNENVSTLEFFVRSTHSQLIAPSKENKSPVLNHTVPVEWHKAFSHRLPDGSSVYIPAGAFYENVALSYYSKRHEDYLSDEYFIQDKDTPLDKNITICLSASRIPEAYRNKAIIVKTDGRRLASAGKPTYKNGVVCVETRTLGAYAMVLDTTAPCVMAKNFRNGKPIQESARTLTVKISDDLSGIAKYTGELNGNWILMEFDGKSGTLSYGIDHQMQQGENILRISLRDGVGNTTEKEFVVIKPH